MKPTKLKKLNQVHDQSLCEFTLLYLLPIQGHNTDLARAPTLDEGLISWVAINY